MSISHTFSRPPPYLGNDTEFGGLLDSERDWFFLEWIVLVAFCPLMIVFFGHVLFHVVAEGKLARRTVGLTAHFADVSVVEERND